jgi:hypothetical protein
VKQDSARTLKSRLMESQAEVRPTGDQEFNPFKIMTAVGSHDFSSSLVTYGTVPEWVHGGYFLVAS